MGISFESNRLLSVALIGGEIPQSWLPTSI
jgi:hypothetical protein